LISKWRSILILLSLTVLAVAPLAEPVSAATREDSFSRSFWDAAVHGPTIGITADCSANPRSPRLTLLASDYVEQQSTNGVASTTEIPPEVPGTAPSHAQPAANSAGTPAQQAGQRDYDDGIISYQHAKDVDLSGPPVGSLDDFMSEGDITSPLGFQVREDKRRLKSGGDAHGLLIMEVFAGSPAARAGLHAYRRTVRNILETAAVAGAMFAPPVVLLVPVFDQVRLGESYDLIIGVDGSRVTNFLDFQDRLRELQPGEIVYFSIVRNGERMQVQVPVPENFAGPTF
jgi:hypothetical protein